MNLFKQWVVFRNQQTTTHKCPADRLDTLYPSTVVDEWLAMFVLEARRADGQYYPGSTVKNILTVL